MLPIANCRVQVSVQSSDRIASPAYLLPLGVFFLLYYRLIICCKCSNKIRFFFSEVVFFVRNKKYGTSEKLVPYFL